VFVVVADDPAAATLAHVKRHLVDAKGWRELAGADSSCRRDGHFCVTVSTFAAQWNYAEGSEDERRWSKLVGVDISETSRLRERGVWLEFTDCCGEPF
jgi:hypothetical protein